MKNKSFLWMWGVSVIENKTIKLHIKTKTIFKLYVLLIRAQYLFNKEVAMRSYEKLIKDIDKDMYKYIKIVAEK